MRKSQTGRRATIRRLVTALALVGLLAGVAAAPAASAATPAPAAIDAPTAASAARPFGSHLVDPAAGAALPPGGRAAADAETAAAYAEWKADYLVAGCGVGRYYVDASTATGSLVVSEGQGYGMVITALMAGEDPSARAIFDGLYRYVDDHPSEVDGDLMAWHQGPDCASVPGDASAATDGDLDIAFALLLADTQWGSAGPIDYAEHAATLIAAIKRSEINPQTHLPLLGDWSAPGDDYWFATRTSDLMIDRFRAFADATADPFWNEVVAASGSLVTTLQAGHAAATGLLPDFVVDTDTTPKPAPPQLLESDADGDFSWNACRTPWRLAAAALLAGDRTSLAAADRMRDWVVEASGGDPTRIRAGYRLDGSPLVNYGSLAFLAPLTAVAAPHLDARAWLDRAWKNLRDAPSGGYYADSIRLQVMLLLSGNTWLPASSPDTGLRRIDGADRFAVAAAVSAATFAPGTATVYLASGEVFPDALSAAAAAGAAGGPVLLVRRGEIPAPVAAELQRLQPHRIVVLGGENTVTASVAEQLLQYATTVDRIGGADRFAVSAAVSAAFPPGRPVYIASGEVFPDALTGAAAVGHLGGPMLLVRRDGVPDAIVAALKRLKPDELVLLGGANTVSEATRTRLGQVAGVPVTRVAGADRFAVGAAVSARAFAAETHGTVFVASGLTFPDALSGGAAAIGRAAPVLLVTRDTVPPAVTAELERLAPSRIVVLGGVNSVSDAVTDRLRAAMSAVTPE